MNNFIFIYIPTPTKQKARKIAKHLLSKKLIACANIHGPTNSLYHWKGKLVDETEYILIGKTIEKHFEKIKYEVERIHSYSTPCIVKIQASVNEKYFEWLDSLC